jgi:hypothetical protein
MRFAMTLGAAMFQWLMVYVQFICPTDEPGCSSSAPEAQLAITGGPSSGRSEPMEIELVPDLGYWSAVVDISECMEGLPEALDDDDDGHSSGSSSSEEEGVGPSQRAVAGPMPQDFLETMTIRNEYHSAAGLGEASLEVGHSFPDKDSADPAIKRYALSISRQHRVKQSDKTEVKVVCLKLPKDCEGRVIARRSRGVCQPWVIRKIVPHSCEQAGTLVDHRNVTVKYVSHIVSAAVEEDINMGIKKLQKAVKDQICYNVSYGKARRAKEDIFKRLYGTYEDIYNYAPKLLNQIVVTNRGTQVFLKYHPLEEWNRTWNSVILRGTTP